MTPAENVAFAWAHRELFAEVARHNHEVTIRRRLSGDWDAPDNQYRNAWREARALAAPVSEMAVA